MTKLTLNTCLNNSKQIYDQFLDEYTQEGRVQVNPKEENK